MIAVVKAEHIFNFSAKYMMYGIFGALGLLDQGRDIMQMGAACEEVSVEGGSGIQGKDLGDI